ncbi:HlyD family secretion protein [Chamaesiphon sp. OTE_20_metabat_361]|uniref:HlyD family secretion protein n=1 Tax=Chamaesiphon sp. OTE_20_metabat_361 TaxID=2964689 RepID=UPI00286A285C|nr:HlyD family secretion protein [Chamaesiphon sp. OTE_20_metabat_361]
MQSTIVSDEKNGYESNKIIVSEQELTTDRHSLKERSPDVALDKVPSPDVAGGAPVEHPPAPKKKKPIALILAGLGVGAIAASISGYRYLQFASSHQTTDNATVAGHIHQISSKIGGTVTNVLVTDNQQVQPGQLLVKLDPKDYENKVQQAQAALEAARKQASAAQANIELASQTTTGKTSQAKGDVSTAQAGIATAQAVVREAQSGIPAAQAAVTEAQAGIPLAQAQVAQADANLQKTQTDYNRYNTLYRQGAVASQQLDTARAAYAVAQAQKTSALQGVQQAQARLASAKVGVAKAQSQLAQAQEGITSAQAKLAASRGGLQQATASGQQTAVSRSQYAAAQSAIAQSQAALKDAQLQLSYINITSATAGRIGRKNVEVGNRIQAGSPLMAVVDNDYWVVANFKETQLDKMKPKQVVEVKLDAFPSHPFKGYVDSVAPASGAQFSLLPPDNATGNFTKIVQRIPVKISLDSQSIKGYETRITPGMSAEVSVEIQ